MVEFSLPKLRPSFYLFFVRNTTTRLELLRGEVCCDFYFFIIWFVFVACWTITAVQCMHGSLIYFFISDYFQFLYSGLFLNLCIRFGSTNVVVLPTILQNMTRNIIKNSSLKTLLILHFTLGKILFYFNISILNIFSIFKFSKYSSSFIKGKRLRTDSCRMT